MSAPLTAAELQKHPEYPHVIWDLKPSQSGKLAVAAGRGGPFNVAWEVHGTGPKHIVFIMGLGGLKSAWQRQYKDFGHTRSSEYSVCVLDNRGMGDSDKPLLRYSTSEMAKDTLEVLDHIGWTAPRSINVAGISMGGMIAQELGFLIPERIASLTLVSTAARIVNTVGFFENLRSRINMFIPKNIDEQIAHAKASIYSKEYLTSPDDTEYLVAPFPTSGDRFGAAELYKRNQPGYFTRTGFMAQAIAAGWHHKSPQQLRNLADLVGRERICVVHGSVDKMISVPHGETLVKELSEGAGVGNGVRKAFWEGQGHVIPIEKRQEFNKLMEEMCNVVVKGKA